MLSNDRQHFVKLVRNPQINAIQQLTQLVTQASRTKSTLQPSTKRIAEVQKYEKIDKQEKIIHTTREINSQQSIRNYFDNSTCKNNKENLPSKKHLYQENRSQTPMAQKSPIVINTRGRGSVSPLRCVQQNQITKSQNKSAFKQTEDPQIMDMVDNLKQNILRDLQEVTKRYQSNNPKPIEMLQKQNQKIKNLLDYKETQIKVPYFDYSSQKSIKHPEIFYYDENSQNKQQFLEQQSQILQQQLEIIKQQQEALRQQQVSVLNSKNNFNNFYNQMKKPQNESIEDIYGKSQYTISNLSSIIPIEASANQNKKINVSFESSLEQNPINLQLEIIQGNDCRTTFGPSQLESLIKSPTQVEPELFSEQQVMKETVKYVQLDNSQGKVSSAKRYSNDDQELVEQQELIQQVPPPSAFSNKSNRYDQLMQNFQSLRKLSREPSFVIETKKSVQMNELNHISDFAIMGSQRESIALCQTKLITFQEVNNSQEECVQSPTSLLGKQQILTFEQDFEQKSIYSNQSQYDQRSIQQLLQKSSLSQQQGSSFQKQSISIQQSTEQTNRILESIRSNESFKQRTASFTEFLKVKDELPIKITNVQKLSVRPAISFLQYKQQNKN
ncbi:unnamed protein product [Paramecium pentaurelia]|uniref:Uncharacterized protein n=1 Tax=Paramecium pentaurelia TaxID=43138 RepID=A0A8S1S1X3_9CILI|nr:unnamed protein product [Paramecium pentaurelia]